MNIPTNSSFGGEGANYEKQNTVSILRLPSNVCLYG